jgi:hypothetical protein
MVTNFSFMILSANVYLAQARMPRQSMQMLMNWHYEDDLSNLKIININIFKYPLTLPF